VCAACLLLTPVAWASTKARHAAPERVRQATAPRRDFSPLVAGPYSITGHVIDFAGSAVQGAEVDWGWWASDTSYKYGGTNLDTQPDGTPADGSFAFSNISGGHQFNGLPADDLSIWYFPTQPGLEEMRDFTLDFSAATDFEMQPGQVDVHVANAPSPVIEMTAGNTNHGFARSDVTLDASGNGAAGVLPMDDFDDVVAYYATPLLNSYSACRSQVEALGTSPVSVTGGNTAAGTVSLDWGNAQRAYLSDHLFRHSGKPGTKVTMVLSGWPKDETASFMGYAGSGAGVGKGSVTSTGADQTYHVPLTIPVTAPVGIYEIDTYRTGLSGTPEADSLVDMWDLYQVCTFKPSVSSIRHGHAVRLSGRVPSNTSVTIYSTPHKASGAPGTLAAKGWHRVGTYKTSLGRFSSSLLHPTRTTWYVVKYKGWAFQAFSSVIKVTVR